MNDHLRSLRFVVAAVAAAMLFVVAACGGGGSGSAASGDATIAIGVQAPPNSLAPAELHDGQQMYVWSAVFDTLVYVDNKNELQPNAAEDWKYSDDARTLTLTLREGMTFSSGKPVTAAAVKTTLDKTRSTAGPQQGNLDAIESIETPDDRTVVLNLKHPDPNLLLAFAQGAGVIGDPDTIDAERTELNPVGSGPYVLDREATVDGSKYVLQRRDDYWNASAYPFQTVTIRVIQDRTAMFNALVAGEIDAGTVDSGQVEQAKGSGLNIKRVDGVSLAALVIADRGGEVTEPLADVRVRRAINMAIDREKVVDKILRGYGQPTVQVFNQKGPVYDEKLDSRYPYDPQRASQLLAEAGYPNGFSVEMPSNFMSKPFEPTITQGLGEIGIKVSWKPVPPQRSGQTTDYGMYFNLGTPSPAPARVAVLFSPNGSHNPFGSETPELTALMDEVSTATDIDEGTDTYRKINEYMVDNAWFAPLFSISATWATRDGIEYLGDGSNTLMSIRTFGVTE